MEPLPSRPVERLPSRPTVQVSIDEWRMGWHFPFGSVIKTQQVVGCRTGAGRGGAGETGMGRRNVLLLGQSDASEAWRGGAPASRPLKERKNMPLGVD